MVTSRPAGSSCGGGGDHDCRFSKADVRSIRRRTGVEAASEDWLNGSHSVELRKPGLTDSLLSAGVGTFIDTCLLFFPCLGIGDASV